MVGYDRVDTEPALIQLLLDGWFSLHLLILPTPDNQLEVDHGGGRERGTLVMRHNPHYHCHSIVFVLIQTIWVELEGQFWVEFCEIHIQFKLPWSCDVRLVFVSPNWFHEFLPSHLPCE